MFTAKIDDKEAIDKGKSYESSKLVLFSRMVKSTLEDKSMWSYKSGSTPFIDTKPINLSMNKELL